MFAKISTSLIATLVLSTTTTLAVPTQTHCRCEIVSDIPSSQTPVPATYIPSAAHWSPANTLPSPVAAVNLCASLGSRLEKLQHTEPELYASYMRGVIKGAQKPIPTSVLMGTHEEEEEEGGDEVQPTSQQEGRILCYSEAQSSSEFHSSFVGLWALQLIVMTAVLACVAEGVHWGKQWMESKNTPEPPCGKHSRLSLSGAEQRLLAIPAGTQQADFVSSPGAEKKLRAYETTRYFVTRASSGKREFIAYYDSDDSDDEANRPVM